ncbi:MAG TPA: nucleotide sugar dehydrogenase [Bacteroidales bacterium]|nr:nucleotide sugar dehydrogenase [Bacteroidales bacterium]
MRISVFGLGYVGVVTAACLAKEGHQVMGIDISDIKVDLIKAGKTPIIEEKIGEMVQEGVDSGRLTASMDTRKAVQETDMAIVCVGTPSRDDGSLDIGFVEEVTKQIGEELRSRSAPFIFVLRSTVLPGTVRRTVIPLLEKHSGKKLGAGIEVVFHPEFLREGSAVRDFYEPPKIIAGVRVKEAGAHVMALYDGIDAPRHFCSLEVAEMVKYSDNLFHAVKITFANEIGMLCHNQGIDSRQVMELFCTDTKLNISSAYLRPGFAFGGSCLPKDMRAILSLARTSNVPVPMLNQVLESNLRQIDRVLNMIINGKAKKIGFWGLSFKPGTDDLRESPMVELAERLLGKGYHLLIWDEFVQINRLIGKNKAYIEQRLPHLAKLMAENYSKLTECDTILLSHPVANEKTGKWLQAGIRIVDLTGENRFPDADNYQAVV